MNIFLTSPEPVACARALDDRRLVKMCLETAQLLSQAVVLNGGEHASLYNVTHQHHPCAKWCRSSLGNFLWLCDHGIALCDEYMFRYGRRHASRTVIKAASECRTVIPPGPLEFTFDCSGKVGGSVYKNYQLCLCDKWANDGSKARWTKREPPFFRCS